MLLLLLSNGLDRSRSSSATFPLLGYSNSYALALFLDTVVREQIHNYRKVGLRTTSGECLFVQGARQGGAGHCPRRRWEDGWMKRRVDERKDER